jgi:hypothetical protein
MKSVMFNGELHNDMYSSPSIVRVIKARRMSWAGNAARIVKRSGVYRVLVGKLVGKNPLGRPGVDWRIILR